jgi:hypothetical protein
MKQKLLVYNDVDLTSMSHSLKFSMRVDIKFYFCFKN